MTNFHIVMSNMTCPMAEYFPPQDPNPDNQILIGEPLAVDGYIELTEKPGFGLELNQDALRRFHCDG